MCEDKIMIFFEFSEKEKIQIFFNNNRFLCVCGDFNLHSKIN